MAVEDEALPPWTGRSSKSQLCSVTVSLFRCSTNPSETENILKYRAGTEFTAVCVYCIFVHYGVCVTGDLVRQSMTQMVHDSEARSYGKSKAVHCNLSQNGIDHQMRPEDMTSQLEEEEESVDAGGVLLDEDSPTYQDVSPPVYHRRSPPHRSVSESELTRPGYVKLSKPVALWTQQDVCKWLKKHCPNQHQIYSDSFKQHDITASAPAPEIANRTNRCGFFRKLCDFGAFNGGSEKKMHRR
ncbi:hypothetical protein F2P81_023179 [Scophthalmus maximus]|uniref:SAM domain-containing protein n=1 Tax=Scophthalmus maximus TaxID=52904 RepID=A0A6A4RVL0_SCOMX|nr:hypothetical protein F2P81_023179 [Scophthalmus maximus]